MYTAAETEKSFFVFKDIYAICHPRDARIQFSETVIDNTLTLFMGVASTEGRIAIYGVMHRPGCKTPVHVTVVRDMNAVETIELMPHKMPEADDNLAHVKVLHGETVCLLREGMKKSGKVHLVCQDKVVFCRSVDFAAPFDGRLDKVQSGRISGWAINLFSEPGTTEIELVINGVTYLTQRTAVPRPDVAEFYPSHTASGFEFNVGLDEMPFDTMSIHTRIN